MSETSTAPVEAIVNLYTSECPSLSGRSTLTYAIGKHQSDGTLHLRIVGNTGKGMWCKNWASAQAIEAIVTGAQALSAKSFQPLHPGKSINTGGFVLAALRDLGLLRVNERNTRLHERVPTATFEKAVMTRMQAARIPAEPAAPKARRKAKEVA